MIDQKLNIKACYQEEKILVTIDIDPQLTPEQHHDFLMSVVLASLAKIKNNEKKHLQLNRIKKA